MGIWLFFAVPAVLVGVFHSPMSLLLLAAAVIAAVLPHAAITLTIACVLGAIVSPLTLSASPKPEMWLMSVMVWSTTGLSLYLFVSAGLWRKRRSGSAKQPGLPKEPREV